MLADVFISSRQWLWPALLALAALAALLGWSYRKPVGSPGTRLLCALLKGLGIAALLACFLEPLWVGERARPGSNYFAVLADNSQGLQVHDAGEKQSRAEHLKQFLTDPSAKWQRELEENFALRRYTFDSKLQSVPGYSDLNFRGESTALGAALRAIQQRFARQPLAGVLLFTDGNTSDAALLQDLAGLPPIYPVVIGSDRPAPDLALQTVTVQQSPFEDAPVTMIVESTASSFSGEKVRVRLWEIPPPGTNTAARMVEEKVETLPSKAAPVITRFQVKPTRRGTTFYRVELAALQPLQEATLVNNQRLVAVDRGEGPYRILYVSGRPNWEYKFLQRAIREDDQLQLTALIRIARREPKFEFRGRRGEQQNPLFSGFDKTDEATERYDQPVLVRLNTLDDTELRGGFPKTPEELFTYTAVVVDDLEAEFFTRDQMMLLQRFVSERGGGLLMLGGLESFARGQYERTPIGDMLPLYLDRLPPARPDRRWKLSLTREGWLQPWIRLRGTEAEERKRLDEMPGFQVLSRTGNVRPGASILAAVTDSETGTPQPALAVNRFGLGRVGALMIGDMWLWGLKDEASQLDLAKAWRQMARWLISDVPGRFDLDLRAGEKDSRSVIVKIKARDEKFQPLDNAAVKFRVRSTPALISTNTNSATSEFTLTAEASTTESGVYQSSFMPKEPGAYQVDASIQDPNGRPLAQVQGGWAADPSESEFKSLKPNRALLEDLARKTGGQVVDFAAVPRLARDLPHKQAPVMETWSSPLWHQPAVFLAALLCFVAEWGIRRSKGMA